ncbi:MAG: putative Ig domain-containing protein, partial [Polyangia bacterium]|nr:putative Ig domain-containing protein [Polyangia bacterium]
MTSLSHLARFSLALLLGFSTLLSLGCPGGGKPSLQPIADQTAEVGVELNLELTASDPDGDSLVFSVSSASIPDLTTRSRPPVFVPFGVSNAYLRWTPLASDVGSHTFTVSVSDGNGSASRSFQVTVTAGNGIPIFREPLGSGTTLDLSQASCVEVDILVDDPDSPQVDIFLEEPLEDGYQLNQDDAMAATFTWCPTAKQIEGSERYTLNLAADDRTGHIGRKKYVIVIRRELGPSCPGNAPVITHTAPGLQQTILNIPISAQISDDLGLSGSPVLYYGLAAPQNPAQPDFSQFVQLSMRRVSGSAQDGQYTTEIPNPVLNDTDGTRRTVYYFIEATDDDDPEGTCDHRTRAPEADVFQVEVERQSSGGTLGACAICLGDAQCLSGRCALLGAGGTAYCLDTCASAGTPCTGGICSPAPMTSLGGLSGYLCLPPGSTCQATCQDDTYEPNDSISDPGVQALTAGQYNNLRLCGENQDFFGLLLDSAALVTATLLFDHDDGDIDLRLLSETGTSLAS